MGGGKADGKGNRLAHQRSDPYRNHILDINLLKHIRLWHKTQ